MPYPKLTDPNRCPGSGSTNHTDAGNGYRRCDKCKRIVHVIGSTGRLFPHIRKSARTAKFDAIHETLAEQPFARNRFGTRPGSIVE